MDAAMSKDGDNEGKALKAPISALPEPEEKVGDGTPATGAESSPVVVGTVVVTA